MNKHILDLHGVSHEDARTKVIHFIEDNWNSSELLEVITGHSIKMQNIVVLVLWEYKLSYFIGGIFNEPAPKIVFWIK